MTSDRRAGREEVRWLIAQTLVFGGMAALLGIVANAMFLGAYGSGWLPVTYIAIGVAGFLVSGVIARLARKLDLLGTALLVLGSAAVAIGASWLVAAGGDGAWVSAPLLVLFPILIQLGFVFVGGQAGRLLDIAGIKAQFPRIAAGFSVGAVLGGLVGGQLVAVLGRTEDLLLATALCQGAFAALVWATGRRFPAQLRPAPAAREDRPRPDVEAPAGASVRRLLGSRFVVLIVAYQVLSAIGSQLADFLVFDRATAQYPDPASLAGYLAGYTAAMNVVSIGFLFLLAGPLLRRYGLRLGIAANPAVLTVFAVAMLAVLGVAGGASFALLATVSAARIADIALTDGTTRTSINALYQVLPQRTRLSVQTAVEGMGVPVAIGLSGVLILVLNALPMALLATIVVTTAVCVVWTWSGVVLYREYGPALGRALHRGRLLVPPSGLALAPGDEAIARGLLASDDPRSTRLGLELLALAAADEPAPALGLRAAGPPGALDAADRFTTLALLKDPDRHVRSAALDAIEAGDLFAVDPAVAALDDPATLDAAAGAVGRLGDGVLPALATALDRAGNPAPPAASRLVRSVAGATAARDDILRRHVVHPDRDLGLVLLERLGDEAPASEPTAAALDSVLAADVADAAAILGAMTALGADGGGHASDGPVLRALADELDLAGARVRAALLARHGSTRLGAAMVELAAGGPDGAIALEAVEVAIGPADARRVAPLLDPSLPIADRLARLAADPSAPGDATGWLRDLVEDPAGRWRSPWLRACAIHAAAGRDGLGTFDLSGARSLGDPIVEEELRAAGALVARGDGQPVGDFPFGQ